jgi:DNA-binding LacI/PurR family transcriptional regulator
VVPFALRQQAYGDVVRSGVFEADDELNIVATETTQEAGAAAMDRLLDLAETPTAVFVGSDGMALGALEALARRGVRVPEDMAVVSFDNIWVARLPGIELTTADSKAREVGRRAARQLLTRIESRWGGASGAPDTGEGPNVQVLPTNLIRRRTCGCQPA